MSKLIGFILSVFLILNIGCKSVFIFGKEYENIQLQSEQHIPEPIDKILDSVVTVNFNVFENSYFDSTTKPSKHSCLGVVIDPYGTVLTSAHCVIRTTSFSVKF